MKFKIILWIGFIMMCTTNNKAQKCEKIIISDDLELIPVSEDAYIHISFTETAGFGRFPSNGLIFINSDSAVVIDTPVTDSLSVQLLSWLHSKKIIVKAVIPTHWHNDNLGGLKAFHDAGIYSYAYALTKKLANQNKVEAPQFTFADSLDISVGDRDIKCRFPGAGHSYDNIVVWIPSERILFGGCMVRSAGSVGLGNTADGDVEAWPDTILMVMKEYPDAEIVIPGHGQPGGQELLQHTYNLLRPE